MGDVGNSGGWPALPYQEWRDTRDTLHMYMQVIGKLRLALSPFEPEWANVPLYVTARGLSTSTIPIGLHTIDAEFDLIEHELRIRSSHGHVQRRPLGGSVAEFYGDVMRLLSLLGVDVNLSAIPSEVAHPIPFPEDRVHDTYEPAHVTRFFRVLSMVDVVTKGYHAGFRGRTTPVHFFWGTFDLAVSRYSGRSVTPPAHAGVIRRFSADAEAICSGWWPGDEHQPYPAFYAYGYPAAPGIDQVRVEPGTAAWDPGVGEFLLPYEAVRSVSGADKQVLRFFNTTYAAAAQLMRWDPELTRVIKPEEAIGAGS